MSTKKLPVQLDPFNYCKNAPPQGTRLERTLLVGDLKNLSSDIKTQSTQPVHVSLTFSQDDEGFCRIEGEIAVDLTMTCQRCMQPMTQAVTATFLVSPVVSDEQAAQLPDRYEPLLVVDSEVNVADWIAEELHLALPFVPRHEPPCMSYDDNTEIVVEEKKPSPFAVLKKKDSS